MVADEKMAEMLAGGPPIDQLYQKADVEQKIMLDVGCGENCQKGFVGMDRRKLSGVQIVHDAEDISWPLEDESCAVIVMSHLIEHIKPWLTIDVINECWRVLEEGGSLMIATPYATSFGFYQDPTHCNPWNEATPTYFMPGQPLYAIYKPKPWHITQLVWSPQGTLELAMKKISEDEANNKDQQKEMA